MSTHSTSHEGAAAANPPPADVEAAGTRTLEDRPLLNSITSDGTKAPLSSAPAAHDNTAAPAAALFPRTDPGSSGAAPGGAPAGNRRHTYEDEPPYWQAGDAQAVALAFLRKMRGAGRQPYQRPPGREIVVACCGAFVSLLLIALVNTGVDVLVPTFAASAVLLFGMPSNPLSQPRNFFFGQVVSAAIGVLARVTIGHLALWLSAPMSATASLAVMLTFGILHPPAGATALIGSVVKFRGWATFDYFLDVGLCACIMLAVALIANNLPRKERWPEWW